ncbi:MAG: prepilin-type N-terminal cleavage/methylation domain-containing protein [Candidatus Omnitrophota bacterium]|nr:prepilin-type N-terminal cleavage/methylation domain-containing protein [Candidatus Omnitrophota bacterium]
MSRLSDKKGLTLIEILISVLLMSIIFLGVSSLYLACRKLYIASSEKTIIGYEIQYAIQHIYKNTMAAIGDETAAPGTSAIDDDPPNYRRVDIRMNTIAAGNPTLSTDPLTKSTYSNVTTYSYYKSGNTLMFTDGTAIESLIPKVTVTAVNFTKTTNALTGYITASYGSQSLTFYFSCYPRLGTFN